MHDHPILAIDYGDARIGLAATDEFAIGAHPVETVDNRKEGVLERIVEVIAERKIQHVLLGLPLRLNGSESKSSEKVRAFAEKLRPKISPVPLTLFDERFTTVTASEKLREAGRKAKNQREVIDQAAALEILNDYLGW
ncbi:MAG: Holliday junction resolvase RuvX [Akkermansiaceae bacterium]